MKTSMGKSDFLTRTLSGILIAAVMVGAVWWSVYSLLLLVTIITAVSLVEFYRLTLPGTEGTEDGAGKKTESGIRVWGYPVLVSVVLLWLVFETTWGDLGAKWLLVLIPLIFLFFIAELYRKNERPFVRIGLYVLGIVYITLPMALLSTLGIERETLPAAGGGAVSVVTSVTYNPLYVLGYVVLIWVNDVGAYLVGMTFGKRKLFERLSPKKSWEGFWGGFGLTVLVSGLMGRYLGENIWIWLLLGVVLSLSAVAGDLVESMLKRCAGVKDSGNLIPGHGGFLDRFDAMFVSVPFVYVLIKVIA